MLQWRHDYSVVTLARARSTICCILRRPRRRYKEELEPFGNLYKYATLSGGQIVKEVSDVKCLGVLFQMI